MMKYIVNGGTLRMGQGTVVALSAAQAARRAHRLERIGGGSYRLKDAQDFKSGEQIGLDMDDVPKSQRGLLTAAEAPADANPDAAESPSAQKRGRK